ncbi:MAG: hypothetical protein J7K84_08790 [Deltaproteobacteria bacterium]|nr:hypothetical protein [Deltaproteobacteria bacterium]
MTINSKKNFTANHNSNLKPDITIQQEITKLINNDRLPCKAAFKIAEKLGISAEQVGNTADILNYRLIGCQLGLFGYKTKKNKATPEGSTDDNLPKGLKKAITNRLVNKKLKCKDCWDIASRFKISRITAGRLCNSMNIKITECQLGAF